MIKNGDCLFSNYFYDCRSLLTHLKYTLIGHAICLSRTKNWHKSARKELTTMHNTITANIVNLLANSPLYILDVLQSNKWGILMIL